MSTITFPSATAASRALFSTAALIAEDPTAAGVAAEASDAFAEKVRGLALAILKYDAADEGDLAQVDDHYADEYGYLRFPCAVERTHRGRTYRESGALKVWPAGTNSDTLEVIWSPDTLVLAARNTISNCEKVERDHRPLIAEGDVVTLGDLTVRIARLPRHTSGVRQEVLD